MKQIEADAKSSPQKIASVEAAEATNLHYVTDSSPGIARRKLGDSFAYIDSNGRRVRDDKILDRIRGLAIPPAYSNVWICPDSRGHLQATGIDARGRKQYKYHESYRAERDASKFDRMIKFGKCLAGIRRRVGRDLSKAGLTREKVLAVIVHLLERSLIRVGNAEYAAENKSFGLTTMRARQVEVSGTTIRFSFLGKSKVRHRIELDDPRVSKVVRKLQDLPGQELFHYLDDEDCAHTISSTDVNAYLREISDGDFTAKDFRTWWGTVLAMIELSGVGRPETKSDANRAIGAAMKNVAKQLGNTPSICRKCYVHPEVIEAFRQGRLAGLSASERKPTEVEDELIGILKGAGLSAKSRIRSG